MKIPLNRTLPKLDISLLCFHFNRMEARKALLTHSSLLPRYSSTLDLDCFNRNTETCGYTPIRALPPPHCSGSVISPIAHLSSQGSEQTSSPQLREPPGLCCDLEVAGAVLQLTASFVSLLRRVPALTVLPVGHGFTDFSAWCLLLRQVGKCRL